MCTNHSQLIVSGLNELNYLCAVSDLIVLPGTEKKNIHHSVGGWWWIHTNAVLHGSVNIHY